MKVELGVIDVPYNKQASFRRVGRRTAPRRVRRSSDMTTGRLADILEAQYGITEFFLEMHGEEMMRDILEGHAQNLARPATGKGSRTDFMNKAVQRAEEMFRNMIDTKEMDGQRPGVPTMASQLGIRFGRSRMPGRPSFVDTGLYRDSFRINVEED